MTISTESKLPVSHEIQELFKKYRKLAEPHEFKMTTNLNKGEVIIVLIDKKPFCWMRQVILAKDIKAYDGDLVALNILKMVEKMKTRKTLNP